MPHLIDEIVNDTMLIVWRKAGTFNGCSKVSTWILGIASRRRMKAMERIENRSGTVDVAEIASPAEAGPEGQHMRQDVLRRAVQALDALPAEQRQVVILTYFEGRSYAEIARIVGCPVNTVKTRMFHARRRFKACFPTAGARHEREGPVAARAYVADTRKLAWRKLGNEATPRGRVSPAARSAEGSPMSGIEGQVLRLDRHAQGSGRPAAVVRERNAGKRRARARRTAPRPLRTLPPRSGVVAGAACGVRRSPRARMGRQRFSRLHQQLMEPPRPLQMAGTLAARAALVGCGDRRAARCDPRAWRCWSSAVTNRGHPTEPSAPPASSASLVVVFDPAATESDFRRSLRAAGARIVDGPTQANAYLLDVPPEHAGNTRYAR